MRSQVAAGLICALVGCGCEKAIVRSDVVGTYISNFGDPPAQLVLSQDGTYLEEEKAGGQIKSDRGEWALESLLGKTILSFQRSNPRSTSAAYPRKQWLSGTVVIPIDEDLGQLYIQKKVP